jgi:hypothetical protein
MPPKQRNDENTPYPKNWRARQRGKKWYILFRVPKAVRDKWGGVSEATLGIGETLAAAEKQAFKLWSDKIVCDGIPMAFGEAFDRYEAEVVPTKAPKTQKSNRRSLGRLRLGIDKNMAIIDFRTHHAFAYRDVIAKEYSAKYANLDLEVLSHVITKCFEWGTPDLVEHPMTGGKITKLYIPPRDRYVEDWEVGEFLSVAGAMLKVYVPLKYALGIDKSMMLTIPMTGLKPNGVEIEKRRKTKNSSAKVKKKFYPYQDDDGNDTGLKALVDDVLAWRKKALKSTISRWLFCTTRRKKDVPAGSCFVKEDSDTTGFDSIWQRTMRKALAETELKVRFTEHDLCAKSSSDVETDEEAARLRGHTNVATTIKAYRRKPVKVFPLRAKSGEGMGQT